MAELDPGLIEAALSMGSSPLEIIFQVYLKESVAAIARGTTITAISLLNLTAMGRAQLAPEASATSPSATVMTETWQM